MTEEELEQIRFERLKILGVAESGSAIVDVMWFTQQMNLIGIVLIRDQFKNWKAYLGSVNILNSIGENSDAKHIAEWGAKVPYSIAKATFPKWNFDETNYDRVD